MSKYQNKYRIETTRLPDYDYSQPGGYFITICTHNRIHYFGEIIDGQMILSEYGKIVESCWKEIPQHYPLVTLDEFIIMPNHFHGILMITDNASNAETRNALSLQGNKFGKTIRGSIPVIVGSFKSSCTKRINVHRKNTIPPIWQRNYYEHIIRNEKSLYEIRNYIHYNPLIWKSDEYYII